MVEVEADVSAGLPAFTVSGRADAACAQAPDRVRAGAANSGHPLPQRRITLNLSPASVPKVGSGFDLAIVMATLAAVGEVPDRVVAPVVHIGELGLDGSVRWLSGAMGAPSVVRPHVGRASAEVSLTGRAADRPTAPGCVVMTGAMSMLAVLTMRRLLRRYSPQVRQA